MSKAKDKAADMIPDWARAALRVPFLHRARVLANHAAILASLGALGTIIVRSLVLGWNDKPEYFVVATVASVLAWSGPQYELTRMGEQ